MKILHVDDGTGWRGGQRQVEFLLPDAAGLIVPQDAPLATRSPVPTFAFGLRGLRRALRHLQPDLIAAHGARSHDLALLQCRVPVVVHRRVDFRRRALKYRAVDGFVAVSQAVKDVLIEGGVAPRRIAVVLDAVEAPVGHPLQRPRGLLVLAAGARVPHKDHRTLIDATLQLGVELWIAGDGPLHWGAPGVRWLGWREDLASLIATADVFCHSSREEGFGSVLLEARSAGIPIVATRAGGAPEAAGPNALLVPPGDAIALTEAIRRAQRLPRRPETLCEHTPRAIRAQTMRAYRHLLGV